MPPTHSTLLANLAHPKLVESIEGTLLKCGIAAQDLADGVAEVQLRALEAKARGNEPTELPRVRALCNRIARDYAIDQVRKRDVQAQHHVGLCEDPDAYADERTAAGVGEGLVDRDRLLGILYDQVVGGELPEHTMAILRAEAAGLRHKVTGQELGLTERAVESRLAAARRRFRERLAELGRSPGTSS